MIGERIKRVRIQLGLSQTQLAGKDLTRSFISQVENGRCLPSPKTLRKLAERLGKPVSYFLEEQDDDVFGARFLWQSAQADVELGNWASARPKLAEALQLIRRAEEPPWACDVQFLYAQCLSRLGEREEALDQYEEVLDRYRATGNLPKVLETWLHMANNYLRLEQYTTARRLYRKVIRHSAGLKTGQELHARALLYLGSTHLYLGELPEAERAFHDTLSSADRDLMPEIWGQAAYGLGAVYRRQKKPKQALEWNQRALERLKAAKSAYAPEAEHNLAVAMMDLGRWERAYALLCQLLAQFRDRGQNQMQAEILQDMMRYWLHKGDCDRAESLCLQALDVLTEAGASHLRGRLYRDLAGIALRRGQKERARELLQVSYELLHHVRAAGELLKTVEAIEALSRS